jgi:hypothetical protein
MFPGNNKFSKTHFAKNVKLKESGFVEEIN